MNYLSLFSSFSTLICCALPSLLVLLGMGAAVASILSAAPWLVTMSREKLWTFSLAGGLISVSFFMTYWVAPRLRLRQGDICLVEDPDTCVQVSKFSRMLLWGSATIWCFGFFMAYILGDILEWYEMLWFRLVCGLVVLVCGYALYFLQSRRYAAAMKMRFGERLEERTRLARDLHDTLLQTIQASKLVADNAIASINEPAALTALIQLSSWLDRAVLEGRAALQSLRSSTTESNHLATALRQAFADCGVEMELQFSATGASKELHPIARDEVYRIGHEAILNGCKHSKGKRLKIDLVYKRNLLLRVCDDGAGIEQRVLEEGKIGHYGLTGMRERAARIGANLTVVTSAKGTTVTLVVPGRAIYRES